MAGAVPARVPLNGYDRADMIDNFALALSHGLILLAAWRLLARPDLEKDLPDSPPATPAADPRAARPPDA